MIFRLVGADNIRRFLAEAGLTQTLVPDSTRVFTGYVFGADNYKTLPGNSCYRSLEVRWSIHT